MSRRNSVKIMLKRVSLALGIFILGLIAYNLIGQIFTTLKSGDRLTQSTDKLHQLEVKNSELKKKLDTVQTNNFIEKEARNRLGLVKEGETLVIIPDEKINLILEASKSANLVRLPNWLGWWKVFF